MERGLAARSDSCPVPPRVRWASRRCYQPHAFLRDEDCRMAMLTLLLGLSEVNFDRLFTQRYRVHIGTWTPAYNS